MPTTRRTFLRTAALTGGALAMSSTLRPTLPWRSDVPPATKPLKILFLGGTGFLGPHTVEAALARGHEVTLFNRQRTNTHLFPEQEKLKGNRDPEIDEGLSALEGREWDAVVDTSGYVPRIVGASAELLADKVAQYVFISSVSVYRELDRIGADEDAPLLELTEPGSEEYLKHYGALKALSEEAAEAALPGRTTVIRPGLIVGPLDRSDRFTYWVVRVARGGDMLCPGSHEDPTQVVDVRDLGEWIVHCTEERVTGVFNATCPDSQFNMGQLIYGCKAALGSHVDFTWVDADFLEEHEVAAWSNLPGWLPPSMPGAGMLAVSNARAYAAGLRHRPLCDTVRDTWAYYEGDLEARRAAYRERFEEEPAPELYLCSAGLPAAKEAEVLAAWRAR